LTAAAQNALLKVLEEPPPRSVLILISSHPDALLATVRSRCQRVQFGPLPTAVVQELLSAAADVDAAGAAELARLAEGSIGRARTLLACLSVQTRDDWRQRLAGLHQARYVQLARTAQELNTPETHVVAKLEMLLSELRDAALDCIRDEPTSAARGVELAAILRRADAVDAACHRIQRSNPNRQLLLEALLLRLAES
jgi:DNA polymerase-3 subunit delta'